MTLPRTDRVALVLLVAALLYFGAWHGVYAGSLPYAVATSYVAESNELRQALGNVVAPGRLPLGGKERNRTRAEYTLRLRGDEASGRVHLELLRVDQRWRVVDATLHSANGAAVELAAEDRDSLRRGTSHSMRGYALRQNGLREEALREFDRAVELDPGNASTYYWRGRLHEEMGDYAGAMEDHTRAIAIDPDYRYAHYALGVVAGRSGDLRKSLVHLERAVALGDGDGSAHFSRAVTRSRLGDEAGALADLKRSCELDYESGCAAHAEAVRGSADRGSGTP